MAGFFGLGYFDIQVSEAYPPLIASVTQAGISMTTLQILLGVGILICQMAIILFSMLDRIGYAIRAIVVPLIRLIPLLAFLTSVWKTYSPIIFNLLPPSFGEVFGVTTSEGYMVQAVSDGTFSRGVIITLITMIIFVIASFALRPRDSAQIKALKSENAKLRKQVRSL
jgi:hypothetical protein